jgi:polyhydroxyalkanoate synthesis regulator phasin
VRHKRAALFFCIKVRFVGKITKIGGMHKMNDLLKQALAVSFGITAIGKEKLESYIDELVNKGDGASQESKQWMARLIEKGEAEKEQLKGVVKEQLQQVLKEFPIATKEDIERVERRLDQLETGAPASSPSPVPAPMEAGTESAGPYNP